MKILHYGFSSPSETFIYDLINALEHQGIDKAILTHHRAFDSKIVSKKYLKLYQDILNKRPINDK